MPDDAFVNKLTDFLKEEREKSDTESKRRVLEGETIKAHAPKQWQEVREWVKSLCDQVNRNSGSEVMTFRITPNKELIVDIKAGSHTRLLQATFDEPTNIISYNSGRSKFTPFVDSAGFGFSDGSNRATIEQMGQTLIRCATDMR